MKRIICIFALVVLLVCYVALPVSASTFGGTDGYSVGQPLFYSRSPFNYARTYNVAPGGGVNQTGFNEESAYPYNEHKFLFENAQNILLTNSSSGYRRDIQFLSHTNNVHPTRPIGEKYYLTVTVLDTRQGTHGYYHQLSDGFYVRDSSLSQSNYGDLPVVSYFTTDTYDSIDVYLRGYVVTYSDEIHDGERHYLDEKITLSYADDYTAYDKTYRRHFINLESALQDALNIDSCIYIYLEGVCLENKEIDACNGFRWATNATLGFDSFHTNYPSELEYNSNTGVDDTETFAVWITQPLGEILDISIVGGVSIYSLLIAIFSAYALSLFIKYYAGG